MSHPLSLLSPPPLENGDKLTRSEFERRYAAMPELKKAELIEGAVHMASPLHANAHGQPHAHIMGWLFNYKVMTPGVQLLDNPTVRLDTENEPQPDALLRIEEGGQSFISPDDYVEGAPELVVEIAASSVSLDLHQKLTVYRRNRVREYLVWRVYDQAFDWFYWQGGEYIPLEANASGILCSKVFPGLWLDREALLKHDLGRVVQVLQQGLATAEHQDFCGRLGSVKSAPQQ